MESFAISGRRRGGAQPTGKEGHRDKDREMWRDSSQDSVAGGGFFSLVTHVPSFLAEFRVYFQLQSVVIEKPRCFLSLVPHPCCSFLESSTPFSQREETGGPERSPPVASRPPLWWPRPRSAPRGPAQARPFPGISPSTPTAPRGRTCACLYLTGGKTEMRKGKGTCLRSPS